MMNGKRRETSGYQWDVFISYRNEGPVSKWTRSIFFPTLLEWIGEFHRPTPRVFLDVETRSIPPGSPWPDVLRDALRRSRCLVPILSAEYFNSNWCMAEFHTVMHRQRQTRTIVMVPIRFSDGDYYSRSAKRLQHVTDLEPYNTWSRKSQVTPPFVSRVKEVCRVLHERLQEAPGWNPRWPVRTPRIPTAAKLQKPNF